MVAEFVPLAHDVGAVPRLGTGRDVAATAIEHRARPGRVAEARMGLRPSLRLVTPACEAAAAPDPGPLVSLRDGAGPFAEAGGPSVPAPERASGDDLRRGGRR